MTDIYFNPKVGRKMLVLQAPIDKDMKLTPFLTVEELAELSKITGIDLKKLMFDNPNSEWYKPNWFSRVTITNEGLHLDPAIPRDRFILALIKSHTDMVSVNPVDEDNAKDIIVSNASEVKMLYQTKVKNDTKNLKEMFKLSVEEKEGLLYLYGIEIDRDADELIYEVFSADKDNISSLFLNTDRKELRIASLIFRAIAAGVISEDYGLIHLPPVLKVNPMAKAALVKYLASDKKQKITTAILDLMNSKNIEKQPIIDDAQ